MYGVAVIVPEWEEEEEEECLGGKTTWRKDKEKIEKKEKERKEDVFLDQYIMPCF